MNIEVLMKYPLSHKDRIIVLDIRLHSENPMLYIPVLHANWNALSLARRALKDKFPTPTIPLTAVLPNGQVFLPDPVFHTSKEVSILLQIGSWNQICILHWKLSLIFVAVLLDPNNRKHADSYCTSRHYTVFSSLLHSFKLTSLSLVGLWLNSWGTLAYSCNHSHIHDCEHRSLSGLPFAGNSFSHIFSLTTRSRNREYSQQMRHAKMNIKVKGTNRNLNSL